MSFQTNKSRPLIISVIGGSEPSARAVDLAYSVGQILAQKGVVVVCGGLSGVMDAVCRGAKSSGGTTIGILPGNDAKMSNEFIDYPIMTGMGNARNIIVVKTGSAVIAIDGSYGTLSEIGHALADGIPVIGLETWELPQSADLPTKIEHVFSSAEAVDKAIEAAWVRENTR
tara:strand:- start:28 stop:540 length:513 start_codon:yes stop_codon:yes gene_type:complete